jgi:NitT/TauT family transport system substrate-binding protein
MKPVIRGKAVHRSLAIALVFVLAFTPVLALSGAFTTSTAVAPAVAQDADLTTVRVGAVPVMIFAPLFVADALGYFADEGLAVEITRVAGGSEPLTPLATGDLDVIFGGAGAGLFNYANRNIRVNDDPGFRIVAGVHSERDPLTSPLVVSRERFEAGEITSVADLEGGRVSINATGAATEYWLSEALAQAGLSTDDVEVVSVAFPDVPAALNTDSAGRIDAAILGEPLVSFAELEGQVVRLSEDFIDDFQATFLYMATDFIDDDRELAVGFVRAYVRASRLLADDDTWSSEEVALILEDYTGVPAEINQNAARPYFPVNGTIDTDDLGTLQDYFLGQPDTLGYDESLDIDLMLDTTLLDEVIADLGVVEEADLASDED